MNALVTAQADPMTDVTDVIVAREQRRIRSRSARCSCGRSRRISRALRAPAVRSVRLGRRGGRCAADGDDDQPGGRARPARGRHDADGRHGTIPEPTPAPPRPAPPAAAQAAVRRSCRAQTRADVRRHRNRLHEEPPSPGVTRTETGARGQGFGLRPAGPAAAACSSTSRTSAARSTSSRW